MATPVVILAVIASCFAAGAVIIFIAGFAPGRRTSTPELWALFRSEFLIVGAFLFPAALGGWIFALFLAAFVSRGLFELYRLFDVPGWGVQQGFAMLGAVALVIAAAIGGLPLLGPVLAAGLALAALSAFAAKSENRVSTTLIGIAGVAIPSVLAASVGVLRASEEGFQWLFLAYATVEIADTFALLIGKLAGRVHPFPKLSPKKTVEGLAAGIVFGGGIGVAIARQLVGLTWTGSVAAVATILAAGLAGDLFASALKRARGKKDFSPVLRMHGGVLDIYDSVLLAAPALYVLRPFLTG